MNAAPVLLWGALIAGLTALTVSLAWFAALDRARRDAAIVGDALLTEIAAHAETRAAHIQCLDDCRRAGLTAARRTHLRSVKP